MSINSEQCVMIHNNVLLQMRVQRLLSYPAENHTWRSNNVNEPKQRDVNSGQPRGPSHNLPVRQILSLRGPRLCKLPLRTATHSQTVHSCRN